MLGTLALPLSALELRDAVRSSRRFDPARLDRVLRLDAERGHAEVQSSASWAALAARAGSEADDFPARWSCAGANIGEAVAANAAGPDGQPMVAHVEGLTLVTPEGDLRRVNRSSHAELFALAVGGQGIFGAPYSITLNLPSVLRAASACLPIESLELPIAAEGGHPLRLLVPPAALEGFLSQCRAQCHDWRTAIGGVRVRRTLAENETVLRWARCEYAEVTVLLQELETIGGSVRAAQLRRQLIDIAISLGGGFPIASTPEATREQVESCYPELRKVLAEKRRLDPAEKLSNAWYRHHRSLLWRESCEVRWGR